MIKTCNVVFRPTSGLKRRSLTRPDSYRDNTGGMGGGGGGGIPKYNE